MLILSYAGLVPEISAQDKDVAPNDTVTQDSIANRDQTEPFVSLEQFLPPSPQASALARYGEYPVSLATGVPEISIPLYDIRLGGYTLPVSISYHASGIKVDDVASTVGLGWVLNAGGCGEPYHLRGTRPERKPKPDRRHALLLLRPLSFHLLLIRERRTICWYYQADPYGCAELFVRYSL